MSVALGSTLSSIRTALRPLVALKRNWSCCERLCRRHIKVHNMGNKSDSIQLSCKMNPRMLTQAHSKTSLFIFGYAIHLQPLQCHKSYNMLQPAVDSVDSALRSNKQIQTSESNSNWQGRQCSPHLWGSGLGTSWCSDKILPPMLSENRCNL